MKEEPKREIWFTDTKRWFWIGLGDSDRIVHWKGYALHALPLAGLLLSLIDPVPGYRWIFVVVALIAFAWIAHRHTEYWDD